MHLENFLHRSYFKIHVLIKLKNSTNGKVKVVKKKKKNLKTNTLGGRKWHMNSGLKKLM